MKLGSSSSGPAASRVPWATCRSMVSTRTRLAFEAGTDHPRLRRVARVRGVLLGALTQQERRAAVGAQELDVAANRAKPAGARPRSLGRRVALRLARVLAHAPRSAVSTVSKC